MKDDIKKAGSAELEKAKAVPRGFEGAQDEDLVKPRIKIAQDMSPIVKEKRAEAGTLYNSITGEVYGESVTVQPIFFFKTRIKWFPREADEDIECQSLDGIDGNKYGKCAECAFKEWGNSKDGDRLPPPCTEIYNFLSLIRDSENPNLNRQIVVLSFLKTTWSEGRHLLSKMRYSGGDMFSKKYKIYIKSTKNKLGEFYIMGSDAGVATSDEEFKEGLSAYNDWIGLKSSMPVDVSREDEQTGDGLTKEDTDKASKEDKVDVAEENIVF